MSKKANTSFKRVLSGFLIALFVFSSFPAINVFAEEVLGAELPPYSQPSEPVATPTDISSGNITPMNAALNRSFRDIATFLAYYEPLFPGMFGTTDEAGSNNLIRTALTGPTAGGNVRASSWTNAVTPTNAFNNIRNEIIANTVGNSWATHGLSCHQYQLEASAQLPMGIAARFDSPQTFDTIVVYGGRSGAPGFTNNQIPRITVETGDAAAFNLLNTQLNVVTSAGPPLVYNPAAVRWPAVGTTGWDLFSGSIATGSDTTAANTNDRVFVFRTDTPVTAEAIRVTMEKIAPGNISQVFINSVEVYNTQAASIPITSPPTANPAPGTFATPQLVALLAPEADTIHYTLDGTTPTTSSPTYSVPINVDTSMTIRAIAVSNGIASTDVSFVYTIGSQAIIPIQPTSYRDVAAFLAVHDPQNHGRFGTPTREGAGNIIGSSLTNPVAGGNVRASSWTANTNPINALNGLRQISFNTAAGGSWATEGATDHQNPSLTDMGLAMRFDSPQLFDTIIIYGGQSGTNAHNPLQVPRLTVEIGTSAAFEALPVASTGSTWPAVGAPGWTLLSSINTTGIAATGNRVFVFRTAEPISADAIRVTMEKAATGNISQVFINAFEVYNSQASFTAMPAAYPAPWHFREPIEVTLTAPDGDIRFTTDGSIPTASSPLYTSPISISTNTIIRAISINNGDSSTIAEFEYTFGGPVPMAPSGYAGMADFIRLNDPERTGLFGTPHASGAGNLLRQITPIHMTPAPPLGQSPNPELVNVRASSWSSGALTHPGNAFDQMRQDVLGTADGGGLPAAPVGRSGSWGTHAATDSNPVPAGATNPGIAARFDAPQTFDTVVVYAGGAGTAALIPANVPRVVVETGTRTAFNALNLVQHNGLANHVLWPAVGNSGWAMFSSHLVPDGNTRVFVFRTDTPVTADAVRVTFERAAGTAQILVNALEIYYSMAPPTIVAPTANPAPGHFPVPIDVTLSHPTPGAEIFFTTDGSMPTPATGTRFVAPIHVSGNTTIRAMAYHNDIASDVVDFAYSISDIAPSPYAEFYMSRRGAGFAVITAQYDGMSNVLGRPALVDVTRATGRFPVFRAIDGIPGTVIVGTLHGANGDVVYTAASVTVDTNGRADITIPDSVDLVPNVTYRMAFTLTHEGRTLHDARFFTPITNFDNYRATPNVMNSNNSNVANILVDNANNPFPAIQLEGGRLVYFPDYRGNQIMDFSSVGFRDGSAIPNVPIMRELGPFMDSNRDAWRMIQDAIDQVSAMPLDENGFRGAIYLREGVYRISQPLLIAASGVVLRGAGEGVPAQTSFPRNTGPGAGIPGSPDNPMISRRAYQGFEPGITKIISTWQLNPDHVHTHAAHTAPPAGGPWAIESTSVNRNSSANWDTLVHFIGPAILGTPTNFRSDIIDQYVGAGQNVLHLESAAGLNVGDLIFVHRAIDTNWARANYMNAIGEPAGGWVIGGALAPGIPSTIYQEAFVVHIDPVTNAITIDVPLSDSVDMRWGASFVVRHIADNRIRNVGIENIQGISHFQSDMRPRSEWQGIHIYSYNDENHPMQFISMTNVVDGWARNWVSYHFDRGFTTNTLSRNITVQDAFVLDPVSSAVAGSRRYSFYIRNGSRVLGQRLYSHYSRHAFTWNNFISGPSVFAFSESYFITNTSEPHFRWASGGMFDNVIGRIYVNNRWNFTTSHGWPGVNFVLYNTFGVFNTSQPQTAPNFAIGHWWEQTDENRFMFGPATANTVEGRANFQRTTHGVEILQELGLNGGIVPNNPAYEFGIGRGRPVNPAQDNMPDSLWLQQVLDAGGQSAVDGHMQSMPERGQWIWAYNAIIDPKDETEQLFLSAILVDGVPIDDFDPTVYLYTVELPFGFTRFPAITAESSQNVDIVITTPSVMNMYVTITLIDIDHPHNREQYEVRFDSPSRSPILTASYQQVPGNYALNLLLRTLEHPNAQTPRWASDQNPTWLRLYLGYTPKMLQGVTLGFVPGTGTDVRSYMVRFEYTLDGINWTPITSGTISSAQTPTPEAWTFTQRNSGSFVNSLHVGATVAHPANGLQYFVFDTPVEARFLRVWADGRFNVTNNAYALWNNFWHLSPVFEGGGGFIDTESIAVTGPNTLTVGNYVALNAVVTPANATFDDVLWSSSDINIAYVDPRGIVTGIAPGVVTITAKSLDGVVIANANILTPFADADFELTVTEGGVVIEIPPTITSPASLAVTSPNTAYITLAATGTAPITFTLEGAIPTGVTIASTTSNTTLQIASNAPVGTHVFTIVATNPAGRATQTFTLVISSDNSDSGGEEEPTIPPERGTTPPGAGGATAPGSGTPTTPGTTTQDPIIQEKIYIIPNDIENFIKEQEALVIETESGATITIPYQILSDIFDTENPVEIVVELTVILMAPQQNAPVQQLVTVEINIAVGDKAIEEMSAAVTVVIPTDSINLSSDMNPYRITAIMTDGTIAGGRLNPDANEFILEIYMTGEFVITYREDLRRLLISLDSFEIRDLAGNAPAVAMDVLPYIEYGRIMLPVRFIAEALGADVDWNEASQEITLTIDDIALMFSIGQTLPGMDVSAEIVNGRTMVPLRFIAGLFGAAVRWDESGFVEVIR